MQYHKPPTPPSWLFTAITVLLFAIFIQPGAAYAKNWIYERNPTPDYGDIVRMGFFSKFTFYMPEDGILPFGENPEFFLVNDVYAQSLFSLEVEENSGARHYRYDDNGVVFVEIDLTEEQIARLARRNDLPNLERVLLFQRSNLQFEGRSGLGYALEQAPEPGSDGFGELSLFLFDKTTVPSSSISAAHRTVFNSPKRVMRRIEHADKYFENGEELALRFKVVDRSRAGSDEEVQSILSVNETVSAQATLARQITHYNEEFILDAVDEQVVGEICDRGGREPVIGLLEESMVARMVHRNQECEFSLFTGAGTWIFIDSVTNTSCRAGTCDAVAILKCRFAGLAAADGCTPWQGGIEFRGQVVFGDDGRVESATFTLPR